MARREPGIARRQVLGLTGADVIDVERHFVVGYTDVAAIRELIRDSHIGGIFLARRNVAHRAADDVAAEIAGLQDLRRASGLPPLIVAADQEGGPVSHLSPPLPHPPALSKIAALPPDQQFEAAPRRFRSG